jgi:hypothetical protein
MEKPPACDSTSRWFPDPSGCAEIAERALLLAEMSWERRTYSWGCRMNSQSTVATRRDRESQRSARAHNWPLSSGQMGMSASLERSRGAMRRSFRRSQFQNSLRVYSSASLVKTSCSPTLAIREIFRRDSRDARDGSASAIRDFTICEASIRPRCSMQEFRCTTSLRESATIQRCYCDPRKAKAVEKGRREALECNRGIGCRVSGVLNALGSR